MATKEFNITGNGVQYMNDVATASEQSAQGFKSAKAELRALQNQMLEMDQSSEEFKKASQRASELKDNISDLAHELSANAGNAFESVSNNAGLFGQRLLDLDLKGAGAALRGMGTAVSNINFKALKDEVGGLIQGLGQLGKALLTNPIFLVGAAIAGVIVYWNDLSSAVKNFSISQDEAVEKMMKSEAMMKETQGLKFQQAKIELLVRAVNDHSKSEEDRKKALDEVNKALVANGQAAITDINATNDIIAAKNKLILTLQAEAKVRGMVGYLEELYARQAKEMMDQGVTTALSAEKKMLSVESVFGEAILGMVGTTKQEMSNTQKEIDFITEEIYNSQKALDELMKGGATTPPPPPPPSPQVHKTKVEQLEKEIDLIEEMNQVLDEQAHAQERANDMTAEIEAEGLVLQRREADIALITDFSNQKIELKKVENNALDALDAEQALRAEQRQRELNAKRLQMASDVFGALGNLAQSFGAKSEKDAKRQFDIVKAFNLAQAIVSTYTAVNNALTAGGNPAKLATGAQFVEAGIALAAGLANVIKIQQTKFESKTTPSGGGGLNGSTNVGGAPSPLSLSFLQNQPNQQPPFQAYVISGQVSNSIEAQQLINNQSKL